MSYKTHRIHFSTELPKTACGAEYYTNPTLMRAASNEELVTCHNCKRKLLAHKQNPFIQSPNGKREQDRLRNRELRQLRKGAK
jgi:hypothetical protein